MNIPDKLRKIVIRRAKGLCEYCQTNIDIVIQMENDHTNPLARGGKTNEANLCLACNTCNRHKQAHVTGIDPVTAETFPLFNPRTQSWHEQFEWDESGTRLNGLTPVGRATIERLKINRPRTVEARKHWVAAGWHPPQT